MATAPRSFFRIRYRTAILLLALAMILWSGFSYWSEYSENSARRARELLAPPLGTTCRIILDGDKQHLVGKIVDQSDRWLVLQESSDPQSPNAPSKQLWVPRERVLVIEFE